jgi:hypothetical protein
MKDFFLKRMLKYAAEKLDGYKTIIGGVGLILTGVVGVIGNMFPESTLPAPEAEFILSQFSLGFIALGLGGKAEKLLKK